MKFAIRNKPRSANEKVDYLKDPFNKEIINSFLKGKNARNSKNDVRLCAIHYLLFIYFIEILYISDFYNVLNYITIITMNTFIT